MEHVDFSMDLMFYTATGRWRCTDVGARTVVAIPIEGPLAHADPSWQNGPPYAVAETVFDEHDLPGCSLEPYPPGASDGAVALLRGRAVSLPTIPLALAVVMDARNLMLTQHPDLRSDRRRGQDRCRAVRLLDPSGQSGDLEVFHFGWQRLEPCRQEDWLSWPLWEATAPAAGDGPR